LQLVDQPVDVTFYRIVVLRGAAGLLNIDQHQYYYDERSVPDGYQSLHLACSYGSVISMAAVLVACSCSGPVLIKIIHNICMLCIHALYHRIHTGQVFDLLSFVGDR
jgi:hypothetical protein